MHSLKKELSSLIPSQLAEINRALDDLGRQKSAWLTRPLLEKISLITTIRQHLDDHAAAWVSLVNEKRGLANLPSWAAEEWYEIYTLARALLGYQETLQRLAAGDNLPFRKIRSLASGQIAVRTFPLQPLDWLLFNGISSEV